MDRVAPTTCMDDDPTERRLPVGVGLLLAVGVSVLLWSGLVALLLRA
ncbi:hypothetical protein [Phenylobacterium sp.]